MYGNINLASLGLNLIFSVQLDLSVNTFLLFLYYFSIFNVSAIQFYRT